MTQKVFINEKGIAVFCCPKCDKTKVQDVSRFKKSSAAVRVKCKCPCGHNYTALLERRKYIRRDLKLHGTYIYPKTNAGGKITVVDMSRTGLKLKLGVGRHLKTDETLDIRFRLDDHQKSIVEKEVVIKSIKNDVLGVEFVNTDHYDLFGYYIAWCIEKPAIPIEPASNVPQFAMH